MALKPKNSFFFLMSALFFLAVVPNGYSESLTTTFASNNAQNGNMFEITAIQEVVIRSFDGNLEAPTSANFRIYYKAGTYTGFENNPGAWTLAGTANGVVSNGLDVATPIPINVNVTIPAGQTYSFYITTDVDPNYLRYTDGTAEHTVYVSDANIEILQGIGVEYPFSQTYSPRIWNGTVYYDLAGVIAPTLTGWGMIILIGLLGIGSIHYLRRRRLAI